MNYYEKVLNRINKAKRVYEHIGLYGDRRYTISTGVFSSGLSIGRDNVCYNGIDVPLSRLEHRLIYSEVSEKYTKLEEDANNKILKDL